MLYRLLICNGYLTIRNCYFSVAKVLFILFRDDLIRAIKKLGVLGSGFKVLPLLGRTLVQSVPTELNVDHTTVLQTAQVWQLFNVKKFAIVEPL